MNESKHRKAIIKKIFICLLFILFSLNSIAQQTFFIKEQLYLSHLDSLKLRAEKRAYLEYLIHERKFGENDTLKIMLAHEYFIQNDFNGAIKTYSGVENISAAGKKELGYSLLKERKYDAFFQTNKSISISDTASLIQTLSAKSLSDPENQPARDELKKYIPLMKFVDNKHKSPALAGLFSTVIPGSGKLYCGKKSQFATVLISNVALGLQTWEAGVKDGTNSARFIISGILFSFFYVGNIWGSILEARNYTREQNKELENEILDYNYSLISN